MNTDWTRIDPTKGAWNDVPSSGQRMGASAGPRNLVWGIDHGTIDPPDAPARDEGLEALADKLFQAHAFTIVGNPSDRHFMNKVEFRIALDAARQHDRARNAEEIEKLRLQLAGCGVLAMSNTRETLARNREMAPEYMCASIGDVIRCVEKQMDERERATDLERQLAEADAIIKKQSGIIEQMSESSPATFPAEATEEMRNAMWDAYLESIIDNDPDTEPWGDAGMLNKFLDAALAAAPRESAPTPDFIRVVFDGPPSHESGRFVEVETLDGKGIKFGEWEHDEKYWYLKIPVGQQPTPATEDEIERLASLAVVSVQNAQAEGKIKTNGDSVRIVADIFKDLATPTAATTTLTECEEKLLNWATVDGGYNEKCLAAMVRRLARANVAPGIADPGPPCCTFCGVSVRAARHLCEKCWADGKRDAPVAPSEDARICAQAVETFEDRFIVHEGNRITTSAAQRAAARRILANAPAEPAATTLADFLRLNWIQKHIRFVNRKPREQGLDLQLFGIPTWEMDALLLMRDCSLRQFIDAALAAGKDAAHDEDK